MRKKKGIIALVLVVLSSLFIFTSCKQHHAKGLFMLDYISESLDLSAEQEATLVDIKTEVVAKMKDMRGDKKEMVAQLKEQLGSENIDKDVVRQLIAERRAKKDEIIDMVVDRFADFHSDLSPEQKSKLIAKIDKFCDKRLDRWQE